MKNDKEKETKLRSLKDLSHKMRGLQSDSLKGEQSKMDREDEHHDDQNKDKDNSRSYYRARSSHDNQAVSDNKPNPSMPSNKASLGKPIKHSNAGDSQEVHDEHGPLSAHEPANEESNEHQSELHRSYRSDSMHDDENSSSNPEFHENSHESSIHDSGGSEPDSPEEEAHELSPLTLHPGLMKLLHAHLMSKK